MSTDRPDDFDDVPTLRPVDLPEPKPGFGFWMAVVWCILFLVATQLLALLLCGLPILFVFMAIETARNGPGGLQTPKGVMDWLGTESGAVMVLSILICSHAAGWLFGWLMLRWRVGGRKWKRRIALTRRPSATHWALILIGLPAALTLSTAIEQPIMKYVPSIQDLLNWVHIDIEWQGIEAIEPVMRKAPLGLALLAIAVIGPMDEEFWCRGFLAQGLAFRYRAGWSC